MRTFVLHLLIILLPVFLLPPPAPAQYSLQVAFPDLPAFTYPTEMQPATDGSNRLFVLQQRGLIYVFDNTPSIDTAKVFLDLSDVVAQSGNVTGLFGLAFDPNYAKNRYCYVDFTGTDSTGQLYLYVSRFQVSAADPDSAVKSSRLDILKQIMMYGYHNGGHLEFGRDGYLYIALGDDGPEGDYYGNGQNRTNLLGKILRIDPDSSSDTSNYSIPPTNPYYADTNGYRKEIYAYGLRNPWKFSFDPVTGTLWTGDVGQDRYEEVDTIIAGGNYGWNTMEGFACYNPMSDCDSTGMIPPLWVYDHSGGNQAIIGGYVYRGTAIPDLVGNYIFGDYASGRIWALDAYGVNPPQGQLLLDTSVVISSFGEDSQRNIYVLSYVDGKIYKLLGPATAIQNLFPGIPSTPSLSQNYPNPFNPTTNIGFRIADVGFATLKVYNVLGQLVRTLVSKVEQPGSYEVEFNGINLASGVYFYRLSAGGYTKTMKLMLLK